MLGRLWERPDFVYVIGDAYVDHSSFGPAIISRVLESRGYKVCIISQPDFKDEASVTTFGRPRLGFLVSAGNMDSMVNHYTVNKKRRSKDAYTPGGAVGKRPDNATIVYCNLIRKAYKNIPVIIGGIEASLRRLGHYDYWQDKVKRSILLDSGADLLIYGMGERAVAEAADALDSGIDIKDITFIPGTVYKAKSIEDIKDVIMLPSFASIASDKKSYAQSFKIQYENTDAITAKPLAESYGVNRWVVQNVPQMPLTTEELDAVYELPYMNAYHPSYEAQGGVPAIEEIKFSLTSCRGCFGGCSFCALTFHQGRAVQARSHESLLKEAEGMTQDKDFKGYIHDVGGPTANFRAPACKKQIKEGVCKNRQCLFPSPCKNLLADHSDYISLLKKLRTLPKVKKVFIRSGIRFDYVLADKDNDFLKELCMYHVSGQLRVAPEHVSDNVLHLMGKPSNSVYKEFVKRFEAINNKYKLNQYVLPYLISSHPGSALKDAVALAESIRDMGYMPEQVQDFYPTPSTISTCMYYTGYDPRTMEEVYAARDPHEKAMQRALIQYKLPENYELVKEALIKAGRRDLIGFDKRCLIFPREEIGRRGNERRTSNKKETANVKAGRKEQASNAKAGRKEQASNVKAGRKEQAAGKKTNRKKQAGDKRTGRR